MKKSKEPRPSERSSLLMTYFIISHDQTVHEYEAHTGLVY